MKTKVILQLIITLVLGFALGFLSHSYVTSQKIRNYTWGRGEAMFWKRAMEHMSVTEEQKSKIQPIVRKYSEEGHKIMIDNYHKIEPLWDKMNEEILPVLTLEQQKVLEKLKEERAKKFRERTRKSSNKDSQKRREERKNN